MFHFKNRTETERQKLCCGSSGLHSVLVCFSAGHQRRLPDQTGGPGQGKGHVVCVPTTKKENTSRTPNAHFDTF